MKVKLGRIQRGILDKLYHQGGMYQNNIVYDIGRNDRNNIIQAIVGLKRKYLIVYRQQQKLYITDKGTRALKLSMVPSLSYNQWFVLSQFRSYWISGARIIYKCKAENIVRGRETLKSLQRHGLVTSLAPAKNFLDSKWELTEEGRCALNTIVPDYCDVNKNPFSDHGVRDFLHELFPTRLKTITNTDDMNYSQDVLSGICPNCLQFGQTPSHKLNGNNSNANII